MLSIVVPVFSEEKIVPEFYQRTKAVASALADRYDHEFVFVDDGSKDRTLDILRDLAAADPRVKVISLSRNFGHQFALTAGLDYAGGDTVVVIDGRRAVRACVRAGTNRIGEPGAVLMRTDVARKVGRFDDTSFYVLDLDFWSRALLAGDLYIVPEALAAFRVAAGSASVRIARSQSRDFRKFIDRLSKDDRFGIRARDRAIGKARSLSNMTLRRIVYRWGRAKSD
jgi:glycosyltransferase involved in cell wall biosynthesis